MVKRARNQITKACLASDASIDAWEQRTYQRSPKKKKFTVVTNSSVGFEYAECKKSTISYDSIVGVDAALKSFYYARLIDGNIAKIYKAKTIQCPAHYGGNRLCYLGKLFVLASTLSQTSTIPVRLSGSEVLETDLYFIILEDQIQDEVNVDIFNRGVASFLRSRAPNTVVCRYHFDYVSGQLDCIEGEGVVM